MTGSEADRLAQENEELKKEVQQLKQEKEEIAQAKQQLEQNNQDLIQQNFNLVRKYVAVNQQKDELIKEHSTLLLSLYVEGEGKATKAQLRWFESIISILAHNWEDSN